MKKINYLFVIVAFLGFLAFPSCNQSANKSTKEEPTEEVMESEGEEMDMEEGTEMDEAADSTTVDSMAVEEDMEEAEPEMGE